jgi:hypothetical protein
VRAIVNHDSQSRRSSLAGLVDSAGGGGMLQLPCARAGVTKRSRAADINDDPSPVGEQGGSRRVSRPPPPQRMKLGSGGEAAGAAALLAAHEVPVGVTTSSGGGGGGGGGVVTPAEYLAEVCSLASKQHASDQLHPRQQPAFALSTEALAVLGAVRGSSPPGHICTPTWG